MLSQLKVAKKTVGLKQSLKAVENDTVEKVFIAKDAEERIVKSVIELVEEKRIDVEYVDTMKILGKACGINVGAAIACIVK